MSSTAEPTIDIRPFHVDIPDGALVSRNAVWFTPARRVSAAQEVDGAEQQVKASALPDTSSTLLGRVGWLPAAVRLQTGAARAGPDVEQGLEFAEYGVEGQAGAGAFGSFRRWVQNAWARAARVTWRCQPV